MSIPIHCEYSYLWKSTNALMSNGYACITQHSVKETTHNLTQFKTKKAKHPSKV